VTTRAAFVSTVRSYVGTPTHHQGRLPGVGMDCPAPAICAMWEHGIKPRTWDITGYKGFGDGREIRAYCDEHLIPIEQADLQPADVLLVGWAKGPPTHLGVVFEHPLGGLAMVHADNFRAKAVSETRVKFGRAMRFVAAYSVPGVE
jgi:hypothetical protein